MQFNDSCYDVNKSSSLNDKCSNNYYIFFIFCFVIIWQIYNTPVFLTSVVFLNYFSLRLKKTFFNEADSKTEKKKFSHEPTSRDSLMAAVSLMSSAACAVTPAGVLTLHSSVFTDSWRVWKTLFLFSFFFMWGIKMTIKKKCDLILTKQLNTVWAGTNSSSTDESKRRTAPWWWTLGLDFINDKGNIEPCDCCYV